jgi:hypothetical protein
MVSSVAGFSAVNFAATAGLNRTAASADTNTATTAGTSTPSAADTFMAYMKESPAQRMIDTWLKAHGLDQAKLDAMSPQDREAVMKQMQQDIQDQLKQQTEQKGQLVDLSA